MSVEFKKDKDTIEEYAVSLLATLAVMTVPVLAIMASF